MHTRVKFTSINEIEVMYEGLHVNVKVERDSTFKFIQDLPNITSILFMHVQFTCVCTKNLRDSGKFQP